MYSRIYNSASNLSESVFIERTCRDFLNCNLIQKLSIQNRLKYIISC